MTPAGGPSVGVEFSAGWPPELVVPLARAAEAAGLHSLWFCEDCFKGSGPATAATALAVTERITVGIGLIPVPLRQVAMAAMEIATLQRLFPGRFLPAIGHGDRDWMNQLGVRPASPLTLLREYAVALRRLLAGETVSVRGDYVHLDAVGLRWPPAVPAPLLIGAEGPRTLALAATHGDGTLLTSALPDDRIREDCEIIAAADDGAPHEIAVHLVVTHGADAEERLASHLDGWPPGATGIAASGPDGARRVAAAIDRMGSLGITMVIVHTVDEDPDPVGFVEWVGREVAPRVSA